mgnify:CR=1 FL=1|jgi:hypothetical protein
MSVRSELAKLRQKVGQPSFDSHVKAISDLMDELSAEAAGGAAAEALTLTELMDGAASQEPNHSFSAPLCAPGRP